MSFIPKAHQKAIADEYERIYCKNGVTYPGEQRKLANRYLVNEAKKYGFDPAQNKSRSDSYNDELSPKTNEILDGIKARLGIKEKKHQAEKACTHDVGYKGNGSRPAGMRIDLGD